MAKVTINGKIYVGDDISIVNGVVTIDGARQDNVSGIVKIQITEGVLRMLKTDASVECGDVNGNVDAGGSVACGKVGGTVDAGGSVVVNGWVGGDVDAGGSIVVNR